MSALSFGPVSYNGVIFDTGLKVRCRMETVYTRSERKVKHVKYTFEVDAVVTSDECVASGDTVIDGTWASVTPDTTDGKMMMVRERLLREGGELIAVNVGLGFDLHINPITPAGFPSSVGPYRRASDDRPVIERTDIMFGPKPAVLDWEPIAGSKACRIRWACVFHLPTCVKQPLTENDIAQYEYSIVWSINEAGLTVRTITGVLEVAGNIANAGTISPGGDVTGAGNRVLNDANKYRGQIDRLIPRIEGFSRNTQVSLVAARNKIEFSIADREFDTGGNPLYPGVVQADVSWDVSSDGDMVMNAWNGTLSGTISVMAGLTKKASWTSFLIILKQKLDSLTELPWNKRAGLGDKFEDEKENRIPKGMRYLFRNIQISEELFGRGMTFSVTVWFLSDFDDLLSDLGHTGFFRKLPEKEYNWPDWIGSTSQVQSVYGYRQLTYDRTKEVIIGFCDIRDGDGEGSPAAEDTKGLRDEKILSPKDPLPESSFIEYENRVSVHEDTHTATQVLIGPAKTPYDPTPREGDKKTFAKSEPGETAVIYGKGTGEGEETEVGDHTEEADTDSPGTKFDLSPTGSDNNKAIYRRTSSTFRAQMKGYCVRAGRASPVPYIQSINGGSKCELVGRHVTITPIARSNSPVWLTQWELDFEVDGAPSGDLSEMGKSSDKGMYGQGLSEGII